MLHGGMQAKAVAAHFGVAASTISRLKGRFNETGSVQDRPRSGRPKKKSDADDRYIAVTSRRNKLTSTLNLRNSFMLRQAFVFQHKPFGIAFINVAYVAGVPTKELFLRPTTLARV